MDEPEDEDDDDAVVEQAAKEGGAPELPCNATAMYDYEADDEDELSFAEGDVIRVTEIDGEWTTGTLNGKSGMFPSNYVEYHEAVAQEVSTAVDDAEPIDDGAEEAAAPAAAAPEVPYDVVALYDYEAEDEDELAFAEGDIIQACIHRRRGVRLS